MFEQIQIKQVIDMFHEAMVVFGARGKIETVNIPFCKLVDQGWDDLVGQIPDYSFIPRDQSRALYEWLSDGEKLTHPLQLMMVRSDGEKFPVLLESNWLISDPTQNLLAILVTKAEDVLSRGSSYMMESLAQTADYAIISVSLAGTVVYWNQAAERIYGIQAINAQGMSIQELMPADRRSELFNALEELYTNRQPVEKRLTNLRSNGEMFPVSMSISPISNPKGQLLGTSLIVRDVTKESQEEVRNLMLEREANDNKKFKAISDLTSGITAFNNNLLQAASGELSSVLNALDETSPHVKSLKAIETALDRMANFNKNLSKLAGSGDDFDADETPVCNPAEVLDEVVGIGKEIMPPDVVIQDPIVKDPLPLGIRPDELRDILLGILANARDAMKSGGNIDIVLEKADLAPEEGELPKIPLDPGDYFVFRITDEGQGIPPDLMERIFNPFFTTKGEDSSGMSLYAIQRVVKQRKGYIDLTPGEEKGTIVEIYLPISEPEKPAKRPEGKRVVGGRETILLVDDEELVRSMGERILSTLGYKVILAQDGLEAVQIFKEKKDEIDLVLMDVVMPRMNGLEALKKMKQMAERIPVVISSGYSNIAPMDEIQEAGANHILPKPYKVHDVAAVLRHLLEEVEIDIDIDIDVDDEFGDE